MRVGIGSVLEHLEAASLIRSGETALPEYRFKHSMIQEAAYAGLLRERRAELHRQVAEAILRVDPEAAIYRPAELALHYYHGGDDERAFRFALRAGNLARRNYAHAEAVANYDLALEVAPRLPTAAAPQIREAFLGKGTALEISGQHDEAQRVHRVLEEYARTTGNAALEAEALLRLATSAVVTSERSVDVEASLERAEALARQAGDPLILAKTLWNRGLVDRFRNPLRADGFFQGALEITRGPDCQSLPPEAGVRETEAHILIDQMVSGLTSGRRRMALQYGAEALAVFRQLGNLTMVADALAGLANLHHAGAAFETVIQLSEEGQAISTAIENPWGYTYNGWARLQIDADRADWSRVLQEGPGLLLHAARVPFFGFRLALNAIVTRTWIDLGQPRKGTEYAQAAARLWEEAGSPTEGWAAWVHAVQALSHLSMGETALAAAHLAGLRELPPGVVPGFQNYYYVAPAMAWLDVERGDFERGLRFASDVIERFDVEGTDRFSAEMLFWRGRLHAGRSAWSEACRDFERALHLLKDTGARAIQWPIHAALAAARVGLGNPAAAAEHRQAARVLVHSISDGLADPALRSSFLARPEVASLDD